MVPLAVLSSQLEARASAVVWKSSMRAFLSGRYISSRTSHSFAGRSPTAVRGQRSVAVFSASRRGISSEFVCCRSWSLSAFELEGACSPLLPRQCISWASRVSFVRGPCEWVRVRSCGALRTSHFLFSSSPRGSPAAFDLRPQFPSRRAAVRGQRAEASAPQWQVPQSKSSFNEGSRDLSAAVGRPWLAGLVGGAAAFLALSLVAGFREEWKKREAERAEKAKAAAAASLWSSWFPWVLRNDSQRARDGERTGHSSAGLPPRSGLPTFGWVDSLLDLSFFDWWGDTQDNPGVPDLRFTAAVPFLERFFESAEADLQSSVSEWLLPLDKFLPLQALLPETQTLLPSSASAWRRGGTGGDETSGARASKFVLGALTGVFLLWKAATFSSLSGNHFLLDWLMRHFACSVEALRAGRVYTLLTSSLSHMTLPHFVLNALLIHVLLQQLDAVLTGADVVKLFVLSALGGAGAHLSQSRLPVLGASSFASCLLWVEGVCRSRDTFVTILPLPGVMLTALQLSQLSLVINAGCFLVAKFGRGKVAGLLQGVSWIGHLGGVAAGVAYSQFKRIWEDIADSLWIAALQARLLVSPVEERWQLRLRIENVRTRKTRRRLMCGYSPA